MHLGDQSQGFFVVGRIREIGFRSKDGTRIIRVHVHGKGCQRQKVDAIAIFQSSQIAVSHRHADHIRHTTRITCRCTHPKNIMVSPLDIEIMIIAQRVHNDMRTGATVINISDNMQRVDGQPLDQLTHGYNEGIGTFRTDYGTDDNIDVSMFIGFYTRLVEQLLYDV